MPSSTSQFQETALVGVSRCKLKEMAGFSQQHSVPKVYDDHSANLVSKLAQADIERDVESIFQKLRKVFRLKRTQAAVKFPDVGWGVIETPFFMYSVHATLDESDPSKVCWERAVREIKDADEIGSPEFATIFDDMFDRIEFSFDAPISLSDWIDNIEDLDDEELELEYDSGLTYCHLQLQGMSAVLQITDSKFAVVHRHLTSVEDIVASYLQACQTVESGFADS